MGLWKMYYIASNTILYYEIYTIFYYKQCKKNKFIVIMLFKWIVLPNILIII